MWVVVVLDFTLKALGKRNLLSTVDDHEQKYLYVALLDLQVGKTQKGQSAHIYPKNIIFDFTSCN